MKIGLTFSMRPAEGDSPSASVAGNSRAAAGRLSLPLDDQHEEFDSPETIAALAETLTQLGHEVELLGDGVSLAERLVVGPLPQLAWNIAEGTGSDRSREARVPALLEMFGVPYTGSDPLTLATSLDKDCAKRLVSQAGAATPAWALFDGDWNVCDSQLDRLAFPVFVKPAYEGSSKGILTSSILSDRSQLNSVLPQLFEVYRQPVLIEEYIEGDELTVGLVGNSPPQVIGIMRVLPKNASAAPFVYSLEVKRDWQQQVRYECPAKLSAVDTQAVQQAALQCWKALGCRDVARIDFRLRAGVPYFLEANPLPGLSPNSGDLVILSGQMQIAYADLVARILGAATTRLGLCETELTTCR